MFNLFLRSTRRKALRQLVHELFLLNERDHCWDPQGSVDRVGMDRIIEVIARDKVDPTEVAKMRKEFKKR